MPPKKKRSTTATSKAKAKADASNSAKESPATKKATQPPKRKVAPEPDGEAERSTNVRRSSRNHNQQAENPAVVVTQPPVQETVAPAVASGNKRTNRPKVCVPLAPNNDPFLTYGITKPRPANGRGRNATSSEDYQSVTSERQREVFSKGRRLGDESRVDDEDEVQGILDEGDSVLTVCDFHTIFSVLRLIMIRQELPNSVAVAVRHNIPAPANAQPSNQHSGLATGPPHSRCGTSFDSPTAPTP